MTQVATKDQRVRAPRKRTPAPRKKGAGAPRKPARAKANAKAAKTGAKASSNAKLPKANGAVSKPAKTGERGADRAVAASPPRSTPPPACRRWRSHAHVSFEHPTARSHRPPRSPRRSSRTSL